MIHETDCGRRAAAALARQLLALKKRQDDAGGRARQIKIALVDLLGTFDVPRGIIGPWYYLPSGKGRKTQTLAQAVRAWAKVED